MLASDVIDNPHHHGCRYQAKRTGPNDWSNIYRTAAGVTEIKMGMSSSGQWRFRVAAENANGLGAWSAETGDVVVGTPAAVTGFTATSPGFTQLSVSFE